MFFARFLSDFLLAFSLLLIKPMAADDVASAVFSTSEMERLK